MPLARARTIVRSGPPLNGDVSKLDKAIAHGISDAGFRRYVRRKSSTNAVNQTVPLRGGARNNQ
jgi:hypothetical protein